MPVSSTGMMRSGEMPRCLELELFVEYTLGQAVAGVEEKLDRTFFVLGNFDNFHVTHFHMIGNGGYRALVGLKHGDGDLGIMGQNGAAPAPGGGRH